MDFKSIVFREFTPESLRRIKIRRKEEADRIAHEKLEQEKLHEKHHDEHRRMLKPSEDEEDASKPTPNKELAVGETLPLILQHHFPPELIGKPIEEIDPFYQNDYVCISLIISDNRFVLTYNIIGIYGC